MGVNKRTGTSPHITEQRSRHLKRDSVRTQSGTAIVLDAQSRVDGNLGVSVPINKITLTLSQLLWHLPL